MTYTLFFIPRYQFQKYFYVSLGNNFYCFFVEAPEQLPSLLYPRKSGLPTPIAD